MNVMVMEGFHSGREPDNYCAFRYPGTWWQKAFRSTVLCSNSVMIFILFYFILFLFSIICFRNLNMIPGDVTFDWALLGFILCVV